MTTARSIPPDNPVAPEESPRGVYSVVAVTIGPGQEYAAIVLEGREVLRAASEDYRMLLEAVDELNNEKEESLEFQGSKINR